MYLNVSSNYSYCKYSANKKKKERREKGGKKYMTLNNGAEKNAEAVWNCLEISFSRKLECC
ncbi:hypothetical protein BpHYR1_025467 [Brachionus plicatilis]|uniref:Uncharacterized protein n=1 Tax=Brachionus plicatilis TaxID=10195 RepID=A0A3M7Q331_BRAPC|nr:hypothetical protein BpHYR1_025467 [Brachionus plicatilis]